MFVGEDVLGGKFAIDGGGLGVGRGDVHFWAPDTLAWESLGIGYGAFVDWLIVDGAARLYESLRWPGWEQDVVEVGAGHGLMLYPPTCSLEGRNTLAASKRVVPLAELDSWLKTLAGSGAENLQGFIPAFAAQSWR